MGVDILADAHRLSFESKTKVPVRYRTVTSVCSARFTADIRVFMPNRSAMPLSVTFGHIAENAKQNDQYQTR